MLLKRSNAPCCGVEDWHRVELEKLLGEGKGEEAVGVVLSSGNEMRLAVPALTKRNPSTERYLLFLHRYLSSLAFSFVFSRKYMFLAQALRLADECNKESP
jgi:hypothetical protein